MPNNPADVQLLFRAMLIRVLQEDIVGDATAEQTADRIMAVLHPRSDKECASMVSEAMEITKRPSSEWIAGERIAASVLLRQMSAALLAPRAAEEADRARIVELTETLNVIAVERGELKDVLSRNGFVRCDNPACNCGSWHARYGLYERFQEIKQLLRDADVLNNDTSNLPSKAIELLIQQRNEARQALSGGSENG